MPITRHEPSKILSKVVEANGFVFTAGIVADDISQDAKGQSRQILAEIDRLLGKGADNDGERNEFTCSDGIDNDLDGKADCADFGCRFAPDVTVCRGTPGIRFLARVPDPDYPVSIYTLGP